MPATGRTLTTRELNRAVLARQLLLQRVWLPLPKVLERMAGLQAQYAPAMYIGLWSRVEGMPRNALTRALERRTVVQATLMRVTIHLVSRADYWPLAIAVRDARRALWVRSWKDGPTADNLAAAADRVRERLAGGPVRRAELDSLLGKGSAGINGVGLWVDLVRVPPSGTWERRRADLYGLAENWVGPPPAMAHEATVDHLLRRYLGGFGPATPADAADWSGLPLAEVREALERLPLRRFRTEDGKDLFDLPRAPLPAGDTPAPVRFLPAWDAALLVHARRARILAEEHRPLVFNTKTPHSVNTFLVDGTVAGIWHHHAGRVTIEPFEPLPVRVRREVDEEGTRIAAFHD